VSSRTYLSIGDVLTLLRQEFPDITISKIRFLESQGLVNPERSPSGYRKFYDHDVERLRWVLRQQREHFLPLKVIRDRLARTGDITAADGDFDEMADDAGIDEVDEVEGAIAVAVAIDEVDEVAEVDELQAEELQAEQLPAGRHRTDQVFVERAGVLNGVGLRTSESIVHAVETIEPAEAAEAAEELAAILGAVNGSYEAEASSERLEARSESRSSVLVTASSPPLAPRVSTVKTAQISRNDAENPPREPPVSRAATAAPEPRAVKPTPPAADLVHEEPVAARTPRAPARESSSVLDPGLAANITGASLTLDELCAASGLAATEVASLEGFGLIEPLVVGGALYYDEEGLTVARLVADFARFGIEPRHLRLFRNAVDRELGLIEQVVTPLLRQRNPEARQRAIDAADELARLGQSLRGSILRRALRHHLGG
jgi:DNA-binding transcriptional MerR regulator